MRTPSHSSACPIHATGCQRMGGSPATRSRQIAKAGMQASSSGQKAASSDPAALMRSHSGQALACSAVRADCQKPEASTEKNTETKQDDARCGQALQARNSGSVRKRLRHQTQKKRPFWQMRRNPFKVWPGGANREWAGLSRHLQCRKAPPPPHCSFSLSAAQTNLLQTAKAARAMRSFLCAIVRQGFIQPLQQGCQRSLIAGGQTLA